jgi:hypothetical protein
MLGNVITSASIDAGERWMLNEVTGKPVYSWDSRDHRLRTAYDALRRPVEVYLQRGNGPEILVGRTVYGEMQLNPETLNLRGKVTQFFDQAGVASGDSTISKATFSAAGASLPRSTRLPWTGRQQSLESTTFTGRTRYDALNRRFR